MPELAEVEFYRRIWNAGLGQRVIGVELHGTKRIFRGVDISDLQRRSTGAILEESFRHGKQMVFRFSDGWLGIHLGMTGELKAEPTGLAAGKHDHLVLRLPERSLVFADPRLFGRVLFHAGATEPTWWSGLPPTFDSDAFTMDWMTKVLQRRRNAPIKAVLLMQQFFPGVGNWMADEILWRSRIHPSTAAGSIPAAGMRTLFIETKAVAEKALETIAMGAGPAFGDPPTGWLFHVRWAKGGSCPRCKTGLGRDEIGGRTTAWCPKCQPSLSC